MKRHATAVVALVAALTLTPAGSWATGIAAPDGRTAEIAGLEIFVDWDPAGIETLVVQPRCEGDATEFALVIPTPARSQVERPRADFFGALTARATPRPQVGPAPRQWRARYGEIPPAVRKVVPEEPGLFATEKRAPRRPPAQDLGLVAPAECLLFGPDDVERLTDLLDGHGYRLGGPEAFTRDVLGALAEYREQGWSFTVLRIDVSARRPRAEGRISVRVGPVSLRFAAAQAVVPWRLAALSMAGGTCATTLFVQAPFKADLAGALSAEPEWLRLLARAYAPGCAVPPPADVAELLERARPPDFAPLPDDPGSVTRPEFAGRLGAQDAPPGSGLRAGRFLTRLHREGWPTAGGGTAAATADDLTLVPAQVGGVEDRTELATELPLVH